MLYHNWIPNKTKYSFEWQTPTRAGTRTPIPLEIYTEIFSYLDTSQDDSFTDEDRIEVFRSFLPVCKFFAAVARPIIWGSLPFRINADMSTCFATSVTNREPRSMPLAAMIKKCKIGNGAKGDKLGLYLEERRLKETLALALARMPNVEELTIASVAITGRILNLIKVLAPRLKVLRIKPCVSIGDQVFDEELKDVFGAMHHLEELEITGQSAQSRLLRSSRIIHLSNLRRLYTDASFTIDSCIRRRALEIDGMHVSWQDTVFLRARLRALPFLTHVLIHNVFNYRFGQLPMDIPVDDLPNLISFKAPPGLLPRFGGLGPQLQVLDSTGLNYNDSSHPFLDLSAQDFTTMSTYTGARCVGLQPQLGMGRSPRRETRAEFERHLHRYSRQ